MPRPGHGPGPMTGEKPKNFSASMKRLFKKLSKWRILLIIALVLAAASSVISIVAPNILSDFTDEITLGIKPKTDNLTTVSNKIMESFTGENVNNVSYEIMNDPTVSSENLIAFNEVISKMSDPNYEDKQTLFLSLPDTLLLRYLTDFEIDGILINKQDQLEFLKIMSSLDLNNSTQAKLMETFEKLPGSIYDLVKPEINKNKCKKIAITLAILYVTSSIFSYIQSFGLATVSNNFAKKLRSEIICKINKLPLKYFDNHETGDVLSRVTNDVDTIGMNMNQSLSTLVSSVTMFVGTIIMMFYTEWKLALTAIISSVFGFLFMGLILSKSQKYFNRRQKELGEINGHIEEMYSGHNVVKAYNGIEESLKEFDRLNNKLFISNKMSSFLGGLMQPIMGFVGNLGYVAVCVVGAILVSKNIITFGVIVAFMVYVRLFTNPLSQMAQAMTNLQSTAAASDRVFDFLDEDEMSDESTFAHEIDKDEFKGNIEFKNVKFGYDDSRLIIKNFNASVKPGEKIAIVGPTGAGKTTMVNLLMKFYEINDGDIIIDGHSTKELTREQIHDLFIMVLQDTWLFDGTIRDNIKFNKTDVTDDEIWNALKVVGIDHFVKTLPGGLDAVINENDSISQGQKQLLTIARGMIENEPFLILDEATSNVDTRTEELVQVAMDKLTKGRTSFIIAHRLSTIKNANLILVMNEGNIIEMGTHDELIKKNGFYADLYNSQFKK